MSIYLKLAKVQKELKAPKGQFNSFGKYNYRSCEDILEGLKSVLGDLVVMLTDEIVMVGDRIYVKATATVTDGKESVSSSAFARESLTKKGMDDSQITGTASSYARKYALNGMFLIDDTKDADTADNSQQPTVALISSEQAEQLRSAMNMANFQEVDFCSKAGISKISDLEASRFKGAMDNVRSNMEKAS